MLAAWAAAQAELEELAAEHHVRQAEGAFELAVEGTPDFDRKGREYMEALLAFVASREAASACDHAAMLTRSARILGRPSAFEAAAPAAPAATAATTATAATDSARPAAGTVATAIHMQ